MCGLRLVVAILVQEKLFLLRRTDCELVQPSCFYVYREPNEYFHLYLATKLLGLVRDETNL